MLLDETFLLPPLTRIGRLMLPRLWKPRCGVNESAVLESLPAASIFR
jgi:hypothetical protein